MSRRKTRLIFAGDTRSAAATSRRRRSGRETEGVSLVRWYFARVSPSVKSVNMRVRVPPRQNQRLQFRARPAFRRGLIALAEAVRGRRGFGRRGSPAVRRGQRRRAVRLARVGGERLESSEIALAHGNADLDLDFDIR